MTVSMDFALVVGAEILRPDELDPKDPTLREALSRGAVDGAWIVEIDEIELLDENLWDRLDDVFGNLIRAIWALDAGKDKVYVQLPDTRVRVELSKVGEAEIEIAFEDRSERCELSEFREASVQVIARFVELARAVLGSVPPAFARLQRFVGGATS